LRGKTPSGSPPQSLFATAVSGSFPYIKSEPHANGNPTILFDFGSFCTFVAANLLSLTLGKSFKSFFRSILFSTIHDFNHTADAELWPVPPPYICQEPYATRKVSCDCKHSPWPCLACMPDSLTGIAPAQAALMNLQVLILSWLHLKGPSRAPVKCRAGVSLSTLQWEIIGHFIELSKPFFASSPFSYEDIGRSATKVECVSEALSEIGKKGMALRAHLDPYTSCKARPSGQSLPRSGHCDPHTKVVGSAGSAKVCAARDIDAGRLVFHSVPSYDPKSVFDQETYSAFQDPGMLSISEEAKSVARRRMPVVRVRGTRKNKLDLYKKLDFHERLELVSSESVSDQPRAGLFSVYKNNQKDRLVLDARPPNLFEVSINKWTRFMATILPIIGVYIPAGYVASIYAEDLVDYYYEFIVSHARTRRNVLAGDWSPFEFLDYKCFKSVFKSCKSVAVCLKTLAMGDLNAVEFGQAGHLVPALRSGVLLPHELVFLNSRPPRGPFFGGIIQDDIGLIEYELGTFDNGILAAHSACPHVSVAQQRMKTMIKQYDTLGMVRNAAKSIDRLHIATLWGGLFNGIAGTIRAPPPRCVALAMLTYRLLTIGYGTPELLEIVSGCYISVYLFRRPMMSLLQYVFHARKGHDHHDLLLLSTNLIRELLFNAILLPLAVTNMRADGCERVFAVDASSHTQAVVSAPVPKHVSRELCRHGLHKGGWTKLVSPSEAHMHAKDHLDLAAQVPPQALPSPSFVCEDVATCLQFEEDWSGRYPLRTHINVGEIQSSLRVIKIVGSQQRSVRVPVITDSLVAGFSLTKGRSSSSSLNREISAALGNMLGSDLYLTSLWSRTQFNPADDPTRDVPLRSPTQDMPLWLSHLWNESYGCLDQAVHKHDLHVSPYLLQLYSCTTTRVSYTAHDRARVPESPTGEGLASASRNRATVSVVNKGASTCSPGPSGSGHLHCETSKLCDSADQGRQDLYPPYGSETPPHTHSVLSVSARVALSHFSRSCYLLRKEDQRKANWTPQVPGALDLFAGSRRYAKRLLSRGAPWVLMIDNKHNPDLDLTVPELQNRVLHCIACGCFSNIGGGPPCSSFSQAVTPPTRSPEFPEGNPDASPSMKEKMRIGNVLAEFVALIIVSLPAHMSFWFENPDGSWFWRMPCIIHACDVRDCWLFRIDYCRFGTVYRKRTRFLTDLPLLKHEPILCTRDHAHTVLRGAHASGVLWTQIAEPYPHSVADILALASAHASQWCFSVPASLLSVAVRACQSAKARQKVRALRHA